MAKSKPAELTAEQRRMIRALHARVKAIEGKPLTTRDENDIAWADKLDYDRIASCVIEEFPKGLYCQLSGRQHKVIDEQAIRYDLPLRGDSLDLRDVFAAFHDLLATYGQRITGSDQDKHTLECEKLRAQIAQMEHRTELLKLDLAHANANAIERADVRKRLQWLSSQLRAFGQRLQKEFGDAAVRALNELLDTLEREILTGVLSLEEPIE